MTDDEKTLAHRAVACGAWRWLPGMLVHLPRGPWNHRHLLGHRQVVRVVDHDGPCVVVAADYDTVSINTYQMAAARPDLSDPGTFGCLLAMVREVWHPCAWVRRWASTMPDMSGESRDWFEVVDRVGRRLVAGPRVKHKTETEALIAALEAAPRREGGTEE